MSNIYADGYLQNEQITVRAYSVMITGNTRVRVTCARTFDCDRLGFVSAIRLMHGRGSDVVRRLAGFNYPSTYIGL